MDIQTISADFKGKVSSHVNLVSEGISRYQVRHPFTFDDGDHFVILLKQYGDRWYLTDEGHTIMHLSYEGLSLDKGSYKEVIDNTVTSFGLNNKEGELILQIPEERFGDAFFTFTQALIKISDIKYLERERIKSLFMQEFKEFLYQSVPDSKRIFDYFEPKLDPQGVYPIDCFIRGKMRPLFIFGIDGDSKCQTATNIIYWWERQQKSFDVLAIHENQEEISRKVLARFSDVCGKQFSSLPSNRDRISKYISDLVENNHTGIRSS